MNEERLVFEIEKQENRPNPYPLYAQARQVGICRQHDGTYVVSRYREVSALLHDPRVSSDPRTSPTRGRRRRPSRSSCRTRRTTIGCGGSP